MISTTDGSNTPQDSQSTPICVPYSPALKRIVGSVNAALVVTYLEMHYPSPPPEPPRRYGLPVEVNFARMADDLAVDRRTLGIALTCVCNMVGDGTAAGWCGARRAGVPQPQALTLAQAEALLDRGAKALAVTQHDRTAPKLAPAHPHTGGMSRKHQCSDASVVEHKCSTGSICAPSSGSR